MIASDNNQVDDADDKLCDVDCGKDAEEGRLVVEEWLCWTVFDSLFEPEAGVDLAIVDEVVKEEVPCEQGLPEKWKNYEVSYVELPFPILPVTPSSDLIVDIDLDHFQHKHED